MSAVTTLLPAVDFVMTRTGWLRREYRPTAFTTGPAPASCTAPSTHKVFRAGWLAWGHRGTPPMRTLLLDASICRHSAPTVPAEPTDLLELLASIDTKGTTR